MSASGIFTEQSPPLSKEERERNQQAYEERRMKANDAIIKDFKVAAQLGPKLNKLSFMMAELVGGNKSGKAEIPALCAAVAWGLFARGQVDKATEFGKLFTLSIEKLAESYQLSYDKAQTEFPDMTREEFQTTVEGA